MTLWNPEWKISIQGVEYTDLTIANLKINSGRTDIERQPVAGYANLEILNNNGNAVTVNINDGVTIAVKDSNGDFVNIFGGSITDLEILVASAGSTGLSQRIKITALGALSRLTRAITTGVLSKDYDGNQIYELLKDVLFNNWNELPASQTWNTYNATTTWATAENIGLGEIDQPGEYELAARTSQITDVYSLVAALATSALGYIYEDANGNIGYADANHRQTYFAANGYVELSANDAYANAIKIKTSTGAVKNSITLKYASGEKTAQDLDSIASFGLLATSIDTTLHNATDAQNQADRYIALRGYPRYLFDSITFPIGNPEIGNADRDALLNIFMGMPVKITDLPINMLGGEFTGYVEGWSFSASVNSLALTIFASPREFSEVAQKWNEVNAAETWNSILNTLEWQDAIGVIS